MLYTTGPRWYIACNITMVQTIIYILSALIYSFAIHQVIQYLPCYITKQVYTMLYSRLHCYVHYYVTSYLTLYIKC